MPQQFCDCPAFVTLTALVSDTTKCQLCAKGPELDAQEQPHPSSGLVLLHPRRSSSGIPLSRGEEFRGPGRRAYPHTMPRSRLAKGAYDPRIPCPNNSKPTSKVCTGLLQVCPHKSESMMSLRPGDGQKETAGERRRGPIRGHTDWDVCTHMHQASSQADLGLGKGIGPG